MQPMWKLARNWIGTIGHFVISAQGLAAQKFSHPGECFGPVCLQSILQSTPGAQWSLGIKTWSMQFVLADMEKDLDYSDMLWARNRS